jgi:hypothetical protein
MMVKFTYTEESKITDSIIKQFKVVPYSEISKRLDEATQKTIEFVKNNVKSTC